MASIQMPPEAEMQQKPKQQKAEDAVELQTTADHLVIFEEPKAKPLTSLPTSVIVTSRPGPKPVTQSLFKKDKDKLVDGTNITTESHFGEKRGNAVEQISPETPKPPDVEQKKTPTVTTSNFFVHGPANANQVEEPITLGSLDASKEELEEERKFFDMLFNFDTSNLEQLAPHNGVDCIDLKKPGGKIADHQFGSSEQTTTGDNVKSEESNAINDIESFCELMPDWTIVSEPSPTAVAASGENCSPGSSLDLAEANLLLRPEENIMWGVNSMSMRSKTDSKVKVMWGGITERDEDKGGGASTKEPSCNQKRRMLFSEASGELPKKVRVVQSTSDYLLFISQDLG